MTCIFFFVQCIRKQLLTSVFVISRIIKVEVRVISRRPRLLTLTSTLIILHITKTLSNNCLLCGNYTAARKTLVLFWRLSTFSVANDYMELKAAFKAPLTKIAYFLSKPF